MASLLRNAANAVLGWIVEAVVDLPFELATGWARKAAEKNSKAFEAADELGSRLEALSLVISLHA